MTAIYLASKHSGSRLSRAKNSRPHRVYVVRWTTVNRETAAAKRTEQGDVMKKKARAQEGIPQDVTFNWTV